MFHSPVTFKVNRALELLLVLLLLQPIPADLAQKAEKAFPRKTWRSFQTGCTALITDHKGEPLDSRRTKEEMEGTKRGTAAFFLVIVPLLYVQHRDKVGFSSDTSFQSREQR